MKTLPLPETVLLVGGFFFVALNTPLRAQPGSLDPTFNPMIPWQPGSQVSALAVQTDDRLVVGGNFQSALLRLLTNGSVDPGFQQRNPEGSDVFSWVTSLAVKGGD